MKLEDTIELLQLIQREAYPTGSAEFGLENPNDRDYFCTKTVYEKIKSKWNNMQPTLKDCVVAEADTYGSSCSMLIEAGGIRLHIFVVPDADISIVVAVTALVKEATQRLPAAMRKKAFRVLLFRQLRDMLKMMRDETAPIIMSPTSK